MADDRHDDASQEGSSQKHSPATDIETTEALKTADPELAAFYGGLVESEGNHYATYLLMAKEINEEETARRLDFYLDLDARLVREPNPLPMLH